MTSGRPGIQFLAPETTSGRPGTQFLAPEMTSGRPGIHFFATEINSGRPGTQLSAPGEASGRPGSAIRRRASALFMVRHLVHILTLCFPLSPLLYGAGRGWVSPLHYGRGRGVGLLPHPAVVVGHFVWRSSTGLKQACPVLQFDHAHRGLLVYLLFNILFHCCALRLLDYHFTSVVDIDTLAAGLAAEPRAVQRVPIVHRPFSIVHCPFSIVH